MTAEEARKAEKKLIGEANDASEDARSVYEKKCEELRYSALKRQIYRSSILKTALKRQKSVFDARVLRIQQDLDESLQELRSEAEGGGTTPPGIDPDSVPYEVDYTLSMRDRYVIVKNYYLKYENLAAALTDYEKDAVAKDYLGSYYEYLRRLLILMQE